MLPELLELVVLLVPLVPVVPVDLFVDEDVDDDDVLEPVRCCCVARLLWLPWFVDEDEDDDPPAPEPAVDEPLLAVDE